MTRARDLSEIVNSTGLSVDTDTLVVDSANNRVGVGTASPTAKIYVEGDQYVVTDSGVATNGIHIASATSAVQDTYGGAISFDAGGLGASGIAAVNDSPSDSDSNGLAFFTHSSGVGSEDSAERMRISAAGNVGIGTASPSALLTVASSSTTNVDITTSATNGTAQARFTNDARTYSLGIDNNDSFFVYDATGTSNRFVIDSAGNVGIGESLPDTLLHLTGDNPKLTFEDSGVYAADSVTSTILFNGKDAAGNNRTLAYIEAKQHAGGNGTGSLDFKTRIAGVEASRLTIDSSGRVGINRTPSISNSKLEVGGADDVPLINVEASGVTGGMGIGSTGLQFFHGSSAHMRIDSNGQVGIGYTPDAWSTSLDVIQIGTARGSSVVAGTSGYSVNNHLFMTNNGYAGNEWYYTNNTTALQYYLEGTGNHIWNYAAAGVVGETTTIVSGRKYEITSGVPSPDLTGFGATTNNVGEVFIATGNTTITGGAVTQVILWNEAMRIDTAGNLLVGKTATNYDNDGFQAFADGFVHATGTQAVANSGTIVTLNRKSTDGSIVDFRKDGAQVGSIGSTDGTDLQIGSGNCYLRFDDATNQILPTNAAGTKRNGVLDLGDSDAQFKDLYMSGGVVFGATGGAVTSKTLGDYEEGTFTLTGTSSGYTISAQENRYTKIGNRVFLTGSVTFSAIGTNNSQVTFIGVPFAEDFTEDVVVGVARENTTSGDIFSALLNGATLIMNSMDGISGGSNQIFLTSKKYGYSINYTTA